MLKFLVFFIIYRLTQLEKKPKRKIRNSLVMIISTVNTLVGRRFLELCADLRRPTNEFSLVNGTLVFGPVYTLTNILSL